MPLRESSTGGGTHNSQMLICHQRIGQRERDKKDRSMWCSLDAEAWCFDCGYYVCSMHHVTRHLNHRTQQASDEDRRHHDRRAL